MKSLSRTVTTIAIGTVLSIALLAGCDADGGPEHASFQHFEVNNADLVTVHARGKPDATINAAGDLTIAGKAIATTPAQRQLVARYFTEVQGIRSDAIATGQQGVALAGKAISEVIGGLAAGDPDRIGDRVEAEAGKVEARANQICLRLGEIRTVQENLASTLAEFRPYATIRAEQVSECGDDKVTVRKDTSLIEAVDEQRIDEVRRQVENGADVDARVRGDGTVLIRAAALGDLASVNELIRLGADVNQASRGDGNPLIAAAKHGHLDVVTKLVSAGADVNAVVTGDETPLINAARGGHLDIATFLVEHGADVSKGVTADFGRWRSPLNLAANDEVRAYLTSKGAIADRKS
ncbi:MAG: ankyrin repeat domain-containing protein [Lysobacter sp.]